MLIALDFDGTVCDVAWPNIGAPKLGVIWQAKNAQQAGHTLILWTCREGKMLRLAKKWLREHGLNIRLANKNSTKRTRFFANDSRKIGADVYVDDKSPGSIDWFMSQNFEVPR